MNDDLILIVYLRDNIYSPESKAKRKIYPARRRGPSAAPHHPPAFLLPPSPFSTLFYHSKNPTLSAQEFLVFDNRNPSSYRIPAEKAPQNFVFWSAFPIIRSSVCQFPPSFNTVLIPLGWATPDLQFNNTLFSVEGIQKISMTMTGTVAETRSASISGQLCS